MEPLISLMLLKQGRSYQPGESLECEYQIDAIQAMELQAVEASVLWRTEGKGDEDMGVHYFERRTMSDVENGDLRPLRRFHSTLPGSPLSYDGQIVKIQWFVRLRLFLGRGKELTAEQSFTLGKAAETNPRWKT